MMPPPLAAPAAPPAPSSAPSAPSSAPSAPSSAPSAPSSAPSAGPDHDTPAGTEDFAALLAVIAGVLPAPPTAGSPPETSDGTADGEGSPAPSPADNSVAILGSDPRPARETPFPESDATARREEFPGRSDGPAVATKVPTGTSLPMNGPPAVGRAEDSPAPPGRGVVADLPTPTASASPAPARPEKEAMPAPAPAPAPAARPATPSAQAADQAFDAASRRGGDPVEALPVRAVGLVSLNGPEPVAVRDPQRSHREGVTRDVADPVLAGPATTGPAPAPHGEPAAASAPSRPAAKSLDAAGPAAPAAVLLNPGRVGETAFPDVTAGSPALPATVPDQIVSAVVPLHGRGDGRHEVTLELRPEHLGAIRVEVSVEQQTVHLTLHAADPATGRLLAAALPELRSALAEAGLTAGSVGVGPDGGGGTGARQPNASDEPSERRPGGRGRRTDEPEPPAAVGTVRRSTTGGLDLFL